MLLGLDLPSKPCEDGKIRIFVSVRVTLSTAPTHIALVVKAKTPSADTRTVRFALLR